MNITLMRSVIKDILSELELKWFLNTIDIIDSYVIGHIDKKQFLLLVDHTYGMSEDSYDVFTEEHLTLVEYRFGIYKQDVEFGKKLVAVDSPPLLGDWQPITCFNQKKLIEFLCQKY